MSRAWTRELPQGALAALRGRNREQFAREMHLAELLSPALAALFDRRGEQYGLAGAERRYELFEVVSAYRLDGELAGVRTPILIVDEPDSGPWHGESAELRQQLGALGELLPFSPPSAGEAGREAFVFDWLDARLGEA